MAPEKTAWVVKVQWGIIGLLVTGLISVLVAERGKTFEALDADGKRITALEFYVEGDKERQKRNEERWQEIVKRLDNIDRKIDK